MATMASTYKKDGGHSGPPPRKKVKTSELPLASATRAAIEGLAHTYKKKGTYDELRTKIWQELEKGVCISNYFNVPLRREISGNRNGLFGTIVRMLITSGHCRISRTNSRVHY